MRGFDWVVPCDADEIWYSPFGRVGDVLDAAPADSLFAPAVLYDHMPSALDDPTVENPVERIGWRFVRPGKLPKVACRLVPGLLIGMGNHDAAVQTIIRSDDDARPRLFNGQLVVRHFTWRTPDQYVRKIRNGVAAYAAADLAGDFGNHWRQWADRPDDAIIDWFLAYGWTDDPEARIACEDADERLIFDPAPASSWQSGA